MVASASPAVVARVAISTGVVIIFRTEVIFGSCSASANRRSTSRSVKIPATQRFSSITATAPTCRSTIVRIACSAVASTETEAVSESHISRIFIASPLIWKLAVQHYFVLEHLAILHHKPDIFQNLDIHQRIASNRDQIRVGAG